MQSSGCKRKFSGWLAALALLNLPQLIQAQDKKSDSDEDSVSENVKFDSADGVELRGAFYPASKAKAPAVLMLHRYGGDRKGWDNLARALQKKGLAVLTFDFRGHGESTKVTPDFWKIGNNSNHIRNAKADKKTIRASEFRKEYTPMLVNDIVAAKRYLDKQNDAGLCNSSNLIVIGAEEGAALGCLWIREEWDRLPQIKGALNVVIYDRQAKPFGEDIAAAVWISPSAGLNGRSAGSWISAKDKKEIRDRTPMLFYASSGDLDGTEAAKRLYNDLKVKSKPPDLTFLQDGVKGGKARGVELVNQKDSRVRDDITRYLEKVIDKKGVNAWKMREPEKGVFTKLVDLTAYGFQQLN
jgi:pimeloyl-ACP methyl ester carboxylesterase